MGFIQSTGASLQGAQSTSGVQHQHHQANNGQSGTQPSDSIGSKGGSEQQSLQQIEKTLMSLIKMIMSQLAQQQKSQQGDGAGDDGGSDGGGDAGGANGSGGGCGQPSSGAGQTGDGGSGDGAGDAGGADGSGSGSGQPSSGAGQTGGGGSGDGAGDAGGADGSGSGSGQPSSGAGQNSGSPAGWKQGLGQTNSPGASGSGSAAGQQGGTGNAATGSGDISNITVHGGTAQQQARVKADYSKMMAVEGPYMTDKARKNQHVDVSITKDLSMGGDTGSSSDPRTGANIRIGSDLTGQGLDGVAGHEFNNAYRGTYPGGGSGSTNSEYVGNFLMRQTLGLQKDAHYNTVLNAGKQAGLSIPQMYQAYFGNNTGLQQRLISAVKATGIHE